jgi:hypothetical protein
MFNPRFPHKLRVWRSRKDEFGNAMTNEEGNEILDVVMLAKVVMIDHRPVTLADGSFDTEPTEWIEFGYRNEGKSTRDTLDVMISDYTLATPMFITHLGADDKVEIVDYDRTYWGEVVRKQTFNLGSNIWINEVKN